MGEIDAVVFDMGGVLLGVNLEACVSDFKKLGYDASKLLNPYKQSGPFLKLEKGEISPEELCDIIREEAGKYISDEDIAAALDKFVTEVPEYKLEMLLELRKRKKVYMLSNTNGMAFPDIRRKYFSRGGHTIDDYFDDLFLSFEMGVVKPSDEIFHMMTQRAGLLPGRTLFIDDSADNIAAAGRLGFKTYLAKEKEDFRHIFKDI